MRKFVAMRLVFLVLICAVAAFSAGCTNQESGKKPKNKTEQGDEAEGPYGYRTYIDDGKKRTLSEEFTVDGTTRTLVAYSEGKESRREEIVYDETGLIPVKRTNVYTSRGYTEEIQYDSEGRVVLEIDRASDSGESQTYSWELDLLNDFLFCDFSSLWDTPHYDYFSMWTEMEIYDTEICWRCDDCREKRVEYTWGSDGRAQKITMTCDKEKYNSFLERGEGDIILRASFNSTDSRMEETYDPATRTGHLEWQTRDPDTRRILSVRGEKQYDSQGRLVSFVLRTEQGKKLVITADFREDGYIVTKKETWEENFTDSSNTVIGRYDAQCRLLRQDYYTKTMVSGEMEHTWTEYEYGEDGTKTEREYEWDVYTHDSFLYHEGELDANDEYLLSRYYRMTDNPADGRRKPQLWEEWYWETTTDPEIPSEIYVLTSREYDETGAVCEETMSYSLNLNAYGVDWDSLYTLDSSKNDVRKISYREETQDFRNGGLSAESKIQSSFDSEGRLMSQSYRYNGSVYTMAYDEKGRIVSRTTVYDGYENVTDIVEWEYWGSTED